MFYVTPAFAMTAFALFGLCIGSFLNVVIHRLPKMLEAQFDQLVPELTLSKPASRCSHCGHMIRWFENIPVLSYLFLRGKCSACQAPIGIRYPLIELASALIFAYCAWRWHFTWSAVAYSLFGAALLTLAAIDWDATYLPDDITVPLTWVGLVLVGLGLLPSVTLHQSLAGACLGYISLWLVYWAFKLITRREGMGYGDFKLYAAIGAWLGWQALIPTMLVAASLGAIIGIVMKYTKQERQIDGVSGYVPFGPFLAFGAALELVTSWQL
jgi:leader peptidase (prepilin peptidase)/N-methyltransferase